MTTTAKKTKAPRKLALTSRAKMGAARKAKGLKAMIADLAETVAQTATPFIAATGLDGDTAVPAEQIGEPVSPAPKAKAPKGKASIRATVDQVRAENEAAHVARMDACTQAAEAVTGLSNIKGIESAAACRYVEMLSGDGVTARAVETATGLTMRQRCRIDAALTAAGWRLHYKRNPERDPGDRFSTNLFWIERA
jgi:hypothetical protein